MKYEAAQMGCSFSQRYYVINLNYTPKVLSYLRTIVLGLNFAVSLGVSIVEPELLFEIKEFGTD